MHIHPDIDRRLEDKNHTTAMDHMYTRTKIQKTNTEKQGMIIPERLLTEAVRNTKAFELYDEAQKNNSVGLTMKKGKTEAKSATKSLIVPKSRTKKVTRQSKKKLTTLRDEPTDEEENVQEEETETQEPTMTKRKQADKGKAKVFLEESIISPMSESEEEEQLQLTLRKSKQSEEERIVKLTKKGEGSGTQDVEMATPASEGEGEDKSSEETRSQTLSSSDQDDDESDNEAESSSSELRISIDKTVESDEEKEASKSEHDEASESDESSDEEKQSESNEAKKTDKEEENVNDGSDDETDGDGDDEVHSDTSDEDTTIDIVGVNDEATPVPTQLQPLSPIQVRPQQTLASPTTINPSLLKSLQEQLQKLQKQANEQKKDVEKFKEYNIDEAVKYQVKERLPGEVRKYVREKLPVAVEHYVKDNLEGIVSKKFQTTPITIQTFPPNPSVSDLKGKLMEAIMNDPDENELRKVLIKSIKKAEKKDEACKKTKATKRRHDDSDPDDQPQQQDKRKRISGSTSRIPTITVNIQDDPIPTQSTEEPGAHMEDIPPVVIENIQEPPKEALLVPAPEWINPAAPSYNWFDEMVDAHPDIPEAEELIEGSIVNFTKRIKKVMQTQKFQLSDLFKIRAAGFTEFKTCTTSELEFEYNVDEVARALSENITWEKRPLWDRIYPATDPDDFKFHDFSQPLPLIGPPNRPKIPKEYFFNKDLKYLVHGNTDPQHRYATSLTKFKAASYLLEDLEEQMRGLYSTSVSKYNDEAALCTLHWPKMRKWFYK